MRCVNSVFLQKVVSVGWCDLSFSCSGVAWKSPPMSMILCLCFGINSCWTHVRMSRYSFSCVLLWSCGMYAVIVMMGVPSCGVISVALM